MKTKAKSNAEPVRFKPASAAAILKSAGISPKVSRRTQVIVDRAVAHYRKATAKPSGHARKATAARGAKRR